MPAAADDDDSTSLASDHSSHKTTSSTVQLASIRQVFSFARTRHVKLCIIGAFACTIISGATMPAFAFFFARAFQDLGASTDSASFLHAVTQVAYAFLAIGGTVLVFMTAQSLFIELAAGEMTRELKESWFRALLRQDMAFYDLKDVSGQATLIASNGNRYRKGVGRKFAEMGQFFITFLGAMAYSFYASWRVTLVLLGVAPVLYASTLLVIKVTTTQTARSNEAYAKAGAIVSTAVSSIRTILSLNAVEKMVDKYAEATKEARDTAIGNSWLMGLANGSNFVTMVLSYLVVTLYGSFLLYRNVEETHCDPSGSVAGGVTCDPSGADVFGALMGISIAAAVLPQVSVALEAFAGARAACYPALVAMSRQLESTSGDDEQDKDLEMCRVSSHALQRELAAIPKYEIDSSSAFGIRPNQVGGRIEFKNVTFAFPARPDAQVLKDFSLTVDAGKTVAIVGPSGSGKSTIVSLIERFYDPLAGSIYLDGVDLKMLNVKWLRGQIGMVLQEPKLFGKSIRDNISLGSPGITQEQVEEAAKLAHAHDFIMSFPKGYDTQVGDLGAQLSGGQRQRIAIARVLAKRPKLLLLDEATSSLDSESEAAVQEALDDLMQLKSVTTVVIAHRLSTIMNADMIAVVENGQVVESGTHKELLSLGKVYSGLVEAQRTQASSENTSETNSENGGSQHSSGTRQLSQKESSIPFDQQEDDLVLHFEDVSFRYPARHDLEVLRGFTLSVKEGETLALVGKSGSGKSTIIQLIECFYHPSQGSVKYHGVDLRDINVRWLRDQFGLVSQEATLFATTIEENIRYGCPDATMDDIIDAARKANCHDFIMDFPNKYKTFVGEGGSLVSGGQKQRIAIARALLKKPKVLLLDEATSALDSENEQIVQAALDQIMSDKRQTCIVIAHRLSTIRNADRIAVMDHGKVREIGTHDELMANPGGRYRRLQEMQNLDRESRKPSIHIAKQPEERFVAEKTKEEALDGEEEELTKEAEAKNSKRAWLIGSQDTKYIVVGAIGALLAGLFFPSWGIISAFTIEVLYRRVEVCPPLMPGFDSCDAYYSSAADNIEQTSYFITYGYLGLSVVGVVGNIILFWGFGSATERMNKRVRDDAFKNLLRQEIAWFDVRAPGTITSRLSDDAGMLQAYSGQPVRTLLLSLASVFVGVVVSFVFMWPFALLTLAMLPFLAFGAEMEMRTYLGEDEAEIDEQDEHSPGGLVVETLSNIRTVASLSLEEERAKEYDLALRREDPHPFRTNLVKGGMAGLGQFFQFGSFALMFWWGGWLLLNYPESFSYRSYLISMFALFFSMYGLTLAAEGAVDREKAKAAAKRIFDLTDRVSQIDPLSTEGKKME